MKKFLLSFTIAILLGFTGMAQRATISPDGGAVIQNYELSNMGMTWQGFPFVFANDVDDWSAQLVWADVLVEGTAYLQVSNNWGDWVYYTDSLRVAIVDTTGTNGVEDVMFSWKYGRWLVNMVDTPTVGTLSIYMDQTPKK